MSSAFAWTTTLVPPAWNREAVLSLVADRANSQRRFPTPTYPLKAGEVDAVDRWVRLLRYRLSPFSWRCKHTQTAVLSAERRPARCLRNTAHQFLADQVKGEGLNKSHGGQPSGTSRFGPNDELDCPVPRLTLLFFGATKDVPEAAKMVTAGTACLHSDMQAKGHRGHSFRRRYGP